MSEELFTPYEAWYHDGGLTTYADVFGYNDEKAVEVELIVDRLNSKLQWGANLSVSVLDIGCGTGRFTVLLMDKLCRSMGLGCRSEVDLVDINPEAFDMFRATSKNAKNAELHIRHTHISPWRLVDVTKLQPLYQLVVADHVFYGEPFTIDLVKSLAGIIAPEGVIIVTLQTAESEVYRMRAKAGINTNSAEGFAAILEQSGTKYEILDYKSRLHYDSQKDAFRNWFFAATTVDLKQQRELLNEYTCLDEEGRAYLSNRAKIFLICGGQ